MRPNRVPIIFDVPVCTVRFLFVLVACTFLIRCTERKPANKFSDDTLVRIVDFQDRRLSDSLYQFLTHSDETYRQHAALAFASIQDTAATGLLGELLLNDPSAAVRLNAAFALGQTDGKRSSTLLIQASEREADSLVLQTILEAIGKVADASEIRLENYNGPGVPWLCYRLGLRQLTPPEFNHRIAGYLSSSHNEMGRLGAAHFFAGARTPDIAGVADDLIGALKNDPSAEVRMAAASALRKIRTDAARTALAMAANGDADHRVRINALKSLGDFPFIQTQEVLFHALHDPATNVSIAAAEAIQSGATEQFAHEVLHEARAATNWRVQALLYQCAGWLLGGSDINEEIIKLFRESANCYRKAWLLPALNGADAMPFVVNEMLTSPVPVIRSSAATVLVAMNREETLTPDLRRQFLDAYTRGIATGDVALTGLFTDALADSTLHYREMVTDISFLYEAKRRLSLPRDYESFVPLERAIAFFEDRAPEQLKAAFNHSIDWDLVRKIPAEQQAILNTSKGTLVISLHVNEAPGSVANFVDLARRRYFDGKVVHRVVPNFVIQDGCPRGDGWGSEDYSIRSEFTTLRYRTGSVGMASAGKDTEGTQWFITHSPPPRLDGRYTIFATVSRGMEIVHQIEVGDTVHSVTLSPPLTP